MSIDFDGRLATTMDADSGLERTRAVRPARRSTPAIANNIATMNNAGGFASRPEHPGRTCERTEAS
ncbi:MAG: hypothetical protein OXF05_03860 [Hyphomicrobiales bacterium]|nr:hypothetical protein [Hyphomicrobiales bacterium]